MCCKYLLVKFLRIAAANVWQISTLIMLPCGGCMVSPCGECMVNPHGECVMYPWCMPAMIILCVEPAWDYTSLLLCLHGAIVLLHMDRCTFNCHSACSSSRSWLVAYPSKADLWNNKGHHGFCFKLYLILEEMCPWLFTTNCGVASPVNNCSLLSLFFICTLQLLVSAHPFTSTSSSASAPHFAVLVAYESSFLASLANGSQQTFTFTLPWNLSCVHSGWKQKCCPSVHTAYILHIYIYNVLVT